MLKGSLVQRSLVMGAGSGSGCRGMQAMTRAMGAAGCSFSRGHSASDQRAAEHR